MAAFNIGDRIVGKSVMDDLNIEGHEGTIIGHNDGAYLIMFDERFSYDLHGDNNRCWWVYDSQIEHAIDDDERELRRLIADEQWSKNRHIDPFWEETWEAFHDDFKIGDRIVGNGIQSREDITGYVGKIVKVDRYSCDVIFDTPLRNGCRKWSCMKDKVEFANIEKKKSDWEKNKDADPFGEENWWID